MRTERIDNRNLPGQSREKVTAPGRMAASPNMD